MTIISPPLFAFIDKMSPPRYVHLKKKNQSERVEDSGNGPCATYNKLCHTTKPATKTFDV